MNEKELQDKIKNMGKEAGMKYIASLLDQAVKDKADGKPPSEEVTHLVNLLKIIEKQKGVPNCYQDPFTGKLIDADKVHREVIPKDCCLCDVCNKQLTDENFKALEYMEWYESRLMCSDCCKKYQWRKSKEMMETFVDEFQEGDDLSETELAKPMVLDSW